MTTRETIPKMNDVQHGAIALMMAEAIPADLTFDEAHGIIADKDPFVADVREAFQKAEGRMTTMPTEDEYFNLEVDYDISPMEVVTSAGIEADDWEYLGPQLSGKVTLQARLVHLGWVRNVEDARQRADEFGYRLVGGQARDPFKFKFSLPDGKGPLIFAGDEWQNSDGDAVVTCLLEHQREWMATGQQSDNEYFANWRWLVVDK